MGKQEKQEVEKITNKQRKTHNRNLANAALYDFLSMIRYKSEWTNTRVIQLSQYEPSTTVCSCCGYKRKKISVKVRSWECPKCGAKHDRDLNAAIVIENKAREIAKTL